MAKSRKPKLMSLEIVFAPFLLVLICITFISCASNRGTLKVSRYTDEQVLEKVNEAVESALDRASISKYGGTFTRIDADAMREEKQAAVEADKWRQTWIAALRSGKSKDFKFIVNNYPSAPYREEAISRFIKALVKETRDNLSEMSVSNFIKELPDNSETENLVRELEEKSFLGASQENSPQSWFVYLSKYPASKNAEIAREKYQNTLWDRVSQLKSPLLYQIFLKAYPVGQYTEQARAHPYKRLANKKPKKNAGELFKEANQLAPDLWLHHCARLLSGKLQKSTVSLSESLLIQSKIGAVLEDTAQQLPRECVEGQAVISDTEDQDPLVGEALERLVFLENKLDSVTKTRREFLDARGIAQQLANSSDALIDEFESEELAVETLKGESALPKEGRASGVMQEARLRAKSAFDQYDQLMDDLKLPKEAFGEISLFAETASMLLAELPTQ